MQKFLIFILFYVGSLTSAGAVPGVATLGDKLPVTYDLLRPRMLLSAQKEVKEVNPHPEYIYSSEEPPSLVLTKYGEADVKKQTLYRVVDVQSFTAYTSIEDATKDAEPNVYSIRLAELNENLEPTGTVIDVGTKAEKTKSVLEFKQIPDVFIENETLTTQRAQVGDHIINAFPSQLGNQPISTFSEFEVIEVSKTRIHYTMTYDYTLKLKKLNDASNTVFELKAPGYIPLKEWALLIAPKNIRAFKVWGMEVYY